MKRLGAASGIVSAVLVVVGIILLVQEQIDDDADEQIRSYYADGGNRSTQIVGFFLVALGTLFFLWFLSVLRSRLVASEPGPKTLSALAFGAGSAAAALLVGAVAVLAGTAWTVEISNDFVVDPNLARFGATTGYLLLMGAVLVELALVIATSVLALRTDGLPSWLGWVGFVAVVLAVVEALLLPVFVIPAWVLVVSVVLLMGPPAGRPEVGQPEAI